jgi:hypothetical protein
LLTDSAIEAIAAAVFEKPSPWIAEAYSGFDEEPILFSSKGEVTAYVQTSLTRPRGFAFLFVVYPDMRGRAARETIRLKPGSVDGHTLRYTWQGWGLISIQLTRDEGPNFCSRVAANTQARAEKWASTIPSWDPPNSWNWAAVASNTRRLQRVLKRVT